MNHERAWVATKNGLFELHLHGGLWAIARTSFLGEPVTMLLPPTRGDSRMLASLTTGHHGTTVHASDDAGQNWTEVATPTYPSQPAGAAAPEWKLVQVWALEQARGTVWAGTAPGRSVPLGRFRSQPATGGVTVASAGAPRVVRWRLPGAWNPFDLPAPHDRR